VLQLLKKGPTSTFIPGLKPSRDQQEGSSRIRCPRCTWQPTASSLWMCQSAGAPESFIGGCGTLWNTFSTQGQCPGCAHQWQWTLCPRCEAWSLHRDWYEQRERR